MTRLELSTAIFKLLKEKQPPVIKNESRRRKADEDIASAVSAMIENIGLRGDSVDSHYNVYGAITMFSDRLLETIDNVMDKYE
jgi:hypothetical protein